MHKLYRLPVLLLCCAVLLCCSLPVYAQSEGTSMQITTLEGFLNFAENCRIDSFSENKTVLLCTDIDLTGTGFSGIPIFSGTFDGNGHQITGLQLDAAGSHVGLFRYLTGSAVVRNLQVSGTVTPSGSACLVGGLAGSNSGKIENCSFNGKVSGIDSVGGIAGVNQLTGVISDCTVNGSVYGSHFAGGVSGENYGVIRDSSNYAQVNTTVEQNKVSLENITIDSLLNSESATTVTDIGGICGNGTGVIRGCNNHGDVGYPQIGYNVGGIAGSFSGYIYNSKNTGSVSGRKEVGGIVGQLEPAVSMIYEEDTLQTLQQQMDDMAGITSGAGAHIQNGSNAMDGQVHQVEDSLKDAEEALKVLLPDEEDSEMPDEETIQAAQNALSTSLSDITASLSSMAAISESTLGALYGDLQGISSQMNAISTTIGNASENLGGSIKDVSDSDTADDLTAKLQSCTNQGNVQGDWNVGGIVGAIALENDLDPESDLQLIGNNSMNFDLQLRAVVLSCKNNGQVFGKKQNIGGVSGWVSLGLIKQCVNTAAVDASSADYAGGIAGQSSGYIRSCSVKSKVSGSTYVGGVAGLGSTVTDCHVITQLSGTAEKSGAILGTMENAALERNFYLPVSTDPGAVDGISYDTMAQPLSEDAFFALEALSSSLETVSLTFVFDDGTTKNHSLPYGSILKERLIPDIPVKENAETIWVGPVAVGERIVFDTTFTLEHTPHLTTLESDLISAASLPVFLVQGTFTQGATLSAATREYSGSVAAWTITLPESQCPMTLRCMLPEGYSGDQLQLMLHTGAGWQEADFRVEGRYLVFQISDDLDSVRLDVLSKDYSPYLLGGTLLIIAIAVIVLITAIARKKKSK